MKDYRPAKAGTKEGDTKAPQAWSTFSLFCSEFHPKVKPTNAGISVEHVKENLSETWNHSRDSEKPSHTIKATKLKTGDR